MRLGVAAAYVDGRFLPGDVKVTDGRVEAVGVGAPAGSTLALPGFVDLQVNGIGTVDLLTTDARGYRAATAALVADGVTAFQPTLVSAAPDDVVAALELITRTEGAARSLGAHLEGPFLAESRLGAHDPRWRRDPDPVLMDRFLAAGAVARVTLAPELPGALDLVDVLVARGIVVSCGHSDADAATAHAAFDRGAGSVTHLFNAMALGTHRSPALGMVALTRDDVLVTAILDGHHLGAEAAALAWRAARGRLALVTDRVAEVGEGATLGGRDLDAGDGPPRTSEGILAGSTGSMTDGIRGLCDVGATLEDAVAAATEVPARLARRADVGRLSVGGPADLVVVDDALEVRTTLVAGRLPSPTSGT